MYKHIISFLEATQETSCRNCPDQGFSNQGSGTPETLQEVVQGSVEMFEINNRKKNCAKSNTKKNLIKTNRNVINE